MVASLMSPLDRMRRVASNPSSTGIWQSIKTRSKEDAVRASQARRPFSTITPVGLFSKQLDHVVEESLCFELNNFDLESAGLDLGEIQNVVDDF